MRWLDFLKGFIAAIGIAICIFLGVLVGIYIVYSIHPKEVQVEEDNSSGRSNIGDSDSDWVDIPDLYWIDPTLRY